MAGDPIVVATSTGAPFATRIEVAGHAVHTDAHAESGGGGTAPSPVELFIGSLCACMAMTARIYARRKGIALESARVTGTARRTPNGVVTAIDLQVELGGSLTPEERQRVFEIMKHCPIHQTLQGRVEMPMRLA